MNRFRQGLHYSFFSEGEKRFVDVASADSENSVKAQNTPLNQDVKEEKRTDENWVVIYETGDWWTLPELVVVPEATREQLQSQSQSVDAAKQLETDVVIQHTREELDRVENEVISHNENLINTDKVQNNRATWTKMASKEDKIGRGIEKKEQEDEEKLWKELEKQLVNLAKNKKIDFGWTNNEWKCSGDEKKLATSSAKVFSQVLARSTQENPLYEKIFAMCKDKRNAGANELTDAEANARKVELWINSKEKDIKNFYKAFLEYKNRDTQFRHLQGLMGFFEWLKGQEALKEQLISGRTQKIEKKEIRERQKQNKERKGDRDKTTWENIAKFELIKQRTETIESSTEKVISLLCDFNLDWEVNSWDVWYRTWTQFAVVFRRELAMNNMRWSDAVQNLVAYATKMWLKMDWVTDVESFYQWMTQNDNYQFNWYERTRKLQDLIQNSAADFSEILTKWADAGQETLNAMMQAEKIDAEVQQLLEEKAREIKEGYERDINNMTQLSEDEKSQIMTNLGNQLIPALVHFMQTEQSWWAIALPLAKIKWIQAGLNVWMGSNLWPMIWLSIWYWARKELWKEKNTYIAVNASGWVNFEPPCSFIPWVVLSAAVWTDVKAKKRKESLNAIWVGTLELWANIWIVGWFLTRWGAVWYENNKKEWIEKQAKNIHDEVEQRAYWWVDNLSTHGDSPEEKKTYLKNMLKGQFKKSSDDELNRATENLWRIINTFKFDDKTTNDDKKTYAKVIADVFTDQWKSNAMIGITDNKRKISWWRLWIQFFAWIVPVATAVLKFTKYRNARTEESDNSKIRRIDATVNWTWNKQIALEGKYLWSSHVATMNEVLKAYWASGEIQYQVGVEMITTSGVKKETEPRIIIPASIWEARGLDVRISRDLQGFVQKTEDWRYSFPANATYRLLTETGWNQGSAILNICWKNIGANWPHNDESDVSITNTAEMDQLLWDGRLTEGKKYPEWWQFEEVPTQYAEATDVLGKFNDPEVVAVISKLDSYKGKKSREKFSVFMKNKVSALANFEQQKNDLIQVLKEYNNTHRKDNLLNDILSILEDGNVPPENQQLLVDRLMALSAKVNIPDKKTLEGLIAKRKWYKESTMTWPNGQPIFNRLSSIENYRTTIPQEISECQPKVMADIIGATAFYNRSNTSKWLALTWLWVTTVFGWVVKPLEGNDRKIAEEWFLWSEWWTSYVPWVLDKDKSPMEWNNLQNTITNYVKSAVPDLWELSEDNIKKLLRWETIELDTSPEKVKINLDVDYVFYLMWECANESVGMQLWKIHILHQVDDEYQWGFWVNGVESQNTVTKDQQNRGIGFGGALWRKSEWVSTKPWEDVREHTGNQTPWNPAQKNENPITSSGGNADW